MVERFLFRYRIGYDAPESSGSTVAMTKRGAMKVAQRLSDAGAAVVVMRRGWRGSGVRIVADFSVQGSNNA